ncbi:MAG: glycosyltransferase family 2 protein [Candidatus Aureabacteria bacterium]|nr:glycosyltransferase family 2 protein [Candidatus Auribacterota bacterium]
MKPGWSAAAEKFGISAFFPCYNDGGTIASMVALADLVLRQVASDYEIIIVDDGSSDHSREILKELEGKYPRLRVILHEKNRGYGGALRSGFAACRKEWIFYTDGDFQYDVAELPRLVLRAEKGVDIVNGYKISRADPLHRKVIGRLYHHLMKTLFKFKIRDVDCDFRLIRRSALDRITLEHDSGVICVEMVKKLQDSGCVFAEVPVHHFFRAYGLSQFFNLKRVAEVGVDIVKLWWKLVVRKGRAR